MNGSPSVKVALFIRNGGSESPCRWFYVTGIYIGRKHFPIVVNNRRDNLDSPPLLGGDTFWGGELFT